MIACINHPERAAVVNLDYVEDGVEVCEPCILPMLRQLSEDPDLPLKANCGEPCAHIRLVDQKDAKEN